MTEHLFQQLPEEIADHRYRFKNGEEFITRPDLSLKNLLKPLTDRVLDILKKDNLVIIGGPSGIGKSELFLGKGEPKINASGIVEILIRQGTSYMLLDLQSASDTALIRRLISDTTEPISDAGLKRNNELDQSEIVLIDESVIFFRDPEKVPAVKKILDAGKKIVLVGGGRLSSVEQVSHISTALSKVGITISAEQRLKFSPNLFTDDQAIELLTTKGPYTIDDAKKVLIKFAELGIPNMFRTIWFAPFPTKSYSIEDHLKNFSRSNLSGQLTHIEEPK